MECFYSKYRRVTVYEDLAEITVHDFTANLNNRNYLRLLMDEQKATGLPPVLNIVKVRPDLVPYFMDKVKTNDENFAKKDQNGISFMGYVMNAEYNIRLDILKRMKNSSERKKFALSMIDIGNPVETIVESNDMNTFKALYYGLTLRNMVNVRLLGKTVLEYAVAKADKDLFDYLVSTEDPGCNAFMKDYKNVVTKHKDIVTLALVQGEHYIDGITKLLCHCTGIDFKKEFAFNNVKCTKFDYACQVGYKHFVKVCVQYRLVLPSEIRKNIQFIMQITSSDAFIDMLVNEMIPIDVLEQLDDDQNNIFMQSIINKTDLHSKLLDTGYLVTNDMQHTNKRGENALMLAARFAPYSMISLLNNCLASRDSVSILQRNVNGEDFIDILYESEHDNELFYHIVDFGMMESKDLIICKLVTLRSLSFEEYIFIRYQHKLAVEKRNSTESSTDETECAICFTDDIDVETDCHHKFCLKCATRLNECPVCRNKISLYNFLIQI